MLRLCDDLNELGAALKSRQANVHFHAQGRTGVSGVLHLTARARPTILEVSSEKAMIVSPRLATHMLRQTNMHHRLYASHAVHIQLGEHTRGEIWLSPIDKHYSRTRPGEKHRLSGPPSR